MLTYTYYNMDLDNAFMEFEKDADCVNILAFAVGISPNVGWQ